MDEIIIKSDGKEYRFSGDEAKQLFAAMKENRKMKHFEFHSDDGRVFKGDSLKKRIIIKKHSDRHKDIDEDEDLVWIDKDGKVKDLDDVEEFEFFTDDNSSDKIQKRINVEIKDDEKIVTVTTLKDGKENIEVYKGKAAEEYLDKMKSDEKINVNIDVDKDLKGKKIKKIIIEKEEITE